MLDDLSGGFVENVPARAKMVVGSILDVPLLKKMFGEYAFTHVYHLAAYAAENLSHFIKRYNYLTNMVGSANLINQAVNHSVQCFVFTSSIAVYGSGDPPFDETRPAAPEDPYGIAKYAVEQDLAVSKRMFGMDYVIFRPHNVYGEHQNIGDRYRNVVGIFMNQIMQGLPMTIFGDGSQTRAFTHIDDVAPAIAQSAFLRECHGAVLNIGSNARCTVKELAHIVATLMGVKPSIEYREARIEVRDVYADHTRSEAVLGKYIRGIPLEEGLARMAAWVRKTGARQSRRFDEIEVMKNMPVAWARDYFAAD